MYAMADIGTMFVLLCGGGVLYAALRVLYNIFLHPLRRYPGPMLWKAIRLTWIVALQRGYLHQDLLRLHDQYGPVVRIAPNELSYIDAQAWKDIYTSRLGHAVLERNPVWFRKKPAEPWSIMGYDEDAHARFRRAFMGSFSEKAVKDQSPLLEKYVEMMVQRFKQMAVGASATVDVVSWLNFVTFDISADLSFGESFESTSKGEPHPWVEIACRFGKGVALVASINHYGPLESLLRMALPKKVREKMIYHRELTAQMVRKRLQLQDERPDFVNAVLKYNQEKTDKVTAEELELNMSVIVFAGSETTSTAMASALFYLLKTPAAMNRVMEEVRTAFKHEEDIVVNSSSKLEYLSAIINEAMRLGPPSAIGVPRVVSEGGEEICGRWVPGGTFVGVNQYPAFRSATNFSDPEAFIPERFLDKQSPDDNLAVFQPFSVGRHMCIGQRFAWAEMRLILARLLYAFDLSWDVAPTIDDWGEQQTFIFWQKEPLQIRLKRRDDTNVV